MRVGGAMHVTAEGVDGIRRAGDHGDRRGRDEASRTVEIQATLRNADAKLRPGMFVKTSVAGSGGSHE